MKVADYYGFNPSDDSKKQGEHIRGCDFFGKGYTLDSGESNRNQFADETCFGYGCGYGTKKSNISAGIKLKGGTKD